MGPATSIEDPLPGTEQHAFWFILGTKLRKRESESGNAKLWLATRDVSYDSAISMVSLISVMRYYFLILFATYILFEGKKNSEKIKKNKNKGNRIN